MNRPTQPQQAAAYGNSVPTPHPFSRCLKNIAILLSLGYTVLAHTATIQYLYDERGRLVQVIDDSGESAQYRYDAVGNLLEIKRLPANQLTLVAVSPWTGAIGDTVTLSGNGFKTTLTDNTVQFNGTTATVTQASATQLTATVPSGATTGKITVKVGASTVTSSQDFTVLPIPQITSFSPRWGGIGTTVTLTGSGFATPLTRNQIFFSGNQATPSTMAATTLDIKVPTNARSGPITLKTQAGQTTTSSDFIVVPPTLNPGDITAVTRLTLGGPAQTINIATAGKKALALVDVPANAVITFDIRKVDWSGSTQYQLFNPQNKQLITWAASGVDQWTPALRLSAGPHLLSIEPPPTASGNLTIAVNTAADLLITDASVSAKVGPNPDGSFTVPVNYILRNQGMGSTNTSFNIQCYLTTESTLNEKALSASYTGYSTLAAGATAAMKQDCTLPNTTKAGTYTVILYADKVQANPLLPYGDFERVPEVDETNNQIILSQKVELGGLPDLTVTDLKVDPIVVNADGSYTIPIHATIKNQGTSPAKASASGWYDGCYLSTDATLDNTDSVLNYTYRSTDVAPGASYTTDIPCRTNVTTSPGNYTLFVKADGIPGTGKYDPTYSRLTETDETNNVTSQGITLPTLPDLTITDLKVDPIVVNADGSYTIPVHATIKNQGVSPAKASWFDLCYLSTDGTLDTSDPYLTYAYRTTEVAAGASYTADIRCTTNTSTAPGTYTLFFKTDGNWNGSKYDPSGQLKEVDETNNIASQNITLPTLPDLTITDLKVDPIVVNADGSYTIPVHATIKNQGVSPAKASWFDLCYLSTDGTLDTSDPYLTYAYRTTEVAAGASYTADIRCTTNTSTAPGTYTLFFKTDGNWNGSKYDPSGQLKEVDETNNIASQNITLPTLPDLTVTDLKVDPIVVNADGSYTIPVHATIKNQGVSPAKATWYDLCYLSTDGTLDTNDLYLGIVPRSTEVAAGASYTADFLCRTNNTTAPGNYTLFVKADGYWSGNKYDTRSLLQEADESNNVASQSITLPTLPDLTITDLKVDPIVVNADGSYNIPVHATIKNQGVSTAKLAWYDSCYLSTDGTIDLTDFFLGYAYRSTDLAPGASYTADFLCRANNTTAPGNYTLFVKADGYWSGNKYDTRSLLQEADESNNVASQSITLPTLPDLIITDFKVDPVVVNAYGSYTIPIHATIKNQGATPAKASWFDLCYLSTDGTLDTSDLYLIYAYHSTDLAPGASYTADISCRTNATTAPGTYTLFFKTDGDWSSGKYSPINYLKEADETNNAASQPITLP